VALDDAEVAGVGLEEIVGDRANPRDQSEQEVGADIAAHPRHRPFRHAEVARFPDHVAAERCAGEVSDNRDEVEQDVEPDPFVGAGNGEGAFEQMLERLDALADGARAAVERQGAGVDQVRILERGAA
jgi:hypothetical protein